MTREDSLAAWARFFESLTPDSVKRLPELVSEDVIFRDPFNDVAGRAALAAVLHKTFEDCDEPRFIVTDRALGEKAGYLRWDFTFRPKGSAKEWCFEGMSEIHFAPDGRISAHIDHWDTGWQLYRHLPVLGLIVKMVRKKLGVTAS